MKMYRKRAKFHERLRRSIEIKTIYVVFNPVHKRIVKAFENKEDALKLCNMHVPLEIVEVELIKEN